MNQVDHVKVISKKISDGVSNKKIWTDLLTYLLKGCQNAKFLTFFKIPVNNWKTNTFLVKCP